MLLCFILGLSANGCVYLVVGGVAAAGGYAVSRDTIQGEIDHAFDDVWDAAIEVLSIMGIIETQSYELGKIGAIVNGARIKVNIIQLTPSAMRIKVKARKNIFPSIANAQNVYVKIINRADQ